MDCPFYIALSPIHGKGLFANQYFRMGTILMKVSDKSGNATKLGRWINHSWRPNIILHEEEDGYYALASMPIYQGREIVGNYEFSPACIEGANSKW